jgi:hypothetical protein
MTDTAPGAAPQADPESLLELVHRCIDRHGVRLTRTLCCRHPDPDDKRRALMAAIGVRVEQPSRAHGGEPDQLTVLAVLRGSNKNGPLRARKLFGPEGERASYNAGWLFTGLELEVHSLASLMAQLIEVATSEVAFVVRGRPLVDLSNPTRRLVHRKKDGTEPTFAPQPRLWGAYDGDSLPLPDGIDRCDTLAVGEVARRALPVEFRHVACIAQLTANAGFKPGARIRLWYWHSRPVADDEIKRWLERDPSPFDLSLYTPVALHYVAAPEFVDGAVDPCPTRWALLPGDADVVAVPDLTPPPRPDRPAPPRPDREAPMSSPPPRAFGLRGSAAADRYALACYRALAAAPYGQGRATCTRIALRLYGLAKAGLLDPVVVTGRIKGVMIGHGWEPDEATRGRTLADVNRQLAWAWDHATPRGLDHGR